MKKVIITGTTGFLGGWLIDHFIQQEYEVSVVLNVKKSIRKNNLSGYYLRGLNKKCREHLVDLSDETEVVDLVKKVKPDVIIHMAAIGDVRICEKFPTQSFNSSATSTLNLLEAIRITDPEILLISHTTDKVYGQNEPPFTEEMPLRPTHIYEVSKVTQEHLTTSYAHHYGLKVVTIRCGNYFGGYDFNFDRIIPYTIKQLLENKPVELRSNGKLARDFLYIEDAVLINQLFIDRMHCENKDVFGEAFNFSLEINLNVLEVVKLISKLMDKEPDVIVNQSAISEIPDMLLDCSKSRDALNWKPQYDFENGLRKTIDFYKSYFRQSSAFAY